MTEEDLINEAKKEPRWGQHRYLIMVSSSVLAAFILVIISMYIYNNSGAAQLDLSRPGYDASVRQQASQSTDDFMSYPDSGELDQPALDDFKRLYDKQSKQATGIDAFGDDVLSDESLQIEAAK
ncbi:MAG: hypothetical protein L0H36_02335 [bacterium]|nr:hypothetical protein [bacterium]